LTGRFKWSPRKPEQPAETPAQAASSADVLTTSKVFPRFLAALAPLPAPVILDLGAVVGSNVSFFGDRLSCKIYVEDFMSDVEAHSKQGNRDGLTQVFARRLTQAPESVDGILCWDLFDFLERSVSVLLASRLAKMLRRGGALYGFFGTTAVDLRNYSRYVVEGEDTFRVRSYPATPICRTVLNPRDMVKMFDGLTVSESVLLKSNTRETLLRKP